MTDLRTRFALAAEDLVGTQFRLHGRDLITGLDCVGVVLFALAQVGRPAINPVGYGLRNLDHGPYLRLFAKAGFTKCNSSISIGDVAQVSPGPGQLHLLVAATNGDFIHAHALLGRVVRTPPPLSWPIQALWRLTQN